MKNLNQTRDHAARTIVDIVDYANYEGDPDVATPAALLCVDAIAAYTILLLKQTDPTTLTQITRAPSKPIKPETQP